MKAENNWTIRERERGIWTGYQYIKYELQLVETIPVALTLSWNPSYANIVRTIVLKITSTVILDLMNFEIDMINILQRSITRWTLGFPVRTRSDLCASMLDLQCLSSLIDRCNVMFIHTILSLPFGALCRHIFFFAVTFNCRNEASYPTLLTICNEWCHYRPSIFIYKELLEISSAQSNFWQGNTAVFDDNRVRSRCL